MNCLIFLSSIEITYKYIDNNIYDEKDYIHYDYYDNHSDNHSDNIKFGNKIYPFFNRFFISCDQNLEATSGIKLSSQYLDIEPIIIEIFKLILIHNCKYLYAICCDNLDEYNFLKIIGPNSENIKYNLCVPRVNKMMFNNGLYTLKYAN